MRGMLHPSGVRLEATIRDAFCGADHVHQLKCRFNVADACSPYAKIHIDQHLENLPRPVTRPMRRGGHGCRVFLVVHHNRDHRSPFQQLHQPIQLAGSYERRRDQDVVDSLSHHCFRFMKRCGANANSPRGYQRCVRNLLG